MTDDYTVNGKPATVRDGRIVLECDDAEARAFRAWLDAVEKAREDATAIGIGLGIEPPLRGEA